MAQKITPPELVRKIFQSFNKFGQEIKKYLLLIIDYSAINFKTAFKQLNENKRQGLLIIIAFIIIGLLISIKTAFLSGIFLLFFFYKWDRRILLTIAIIFLASCPVLLHYNQVNQATAAAVYAYYFLLIIFLLLIFDFGGHVFLKKIKRL